ncbi:unnamed protein product [Spodoptera littoralis]|uniref:Metalloendopeptidase n=1 Tax=Spodoptera littoralis TaxID=7109 RepID=A0A9P0IC53_SPOLI|nr:unnamed protein product [Spodoptera littoralis]CAH1643529.1 unnamed protein product [Spodoptera littoralis]
MGHTKLSVVLLTVFAVKCLAMTYHELEDFAEYLKKTSQLSPTLKKGADPDVDYDDDEVVSDHAWEESGKFEGDLILNERQRRLIVEDVAEGLARNGISDGTKRWPNNEVIVYIQVEHFTSDQVQAIQNGIEDLARASCVKFRPYKKGDRDAVVIQGSRRGCFSQVGYQGGYQVLNLSGRHPVGRGCFRHGTVVHELLHTLGFYHMQSSPDRDDYVDIVWPNVLQSARHNFRKYNSFSVSDFGVGYDYDSVLHYSRRAFSVNGQDTIVPKQVGAQIGQRIGLSDKDVQKLNKMYCDAESDSGQADENVTKKTESKKKKGKNKPFNGQGLGYHQGKAVVFKILPAAETYKLPDVPSFHVFDYFSKEPQILSTSENEGFRIGKEIAYSYNPPEPMTARDVHLPAHMDHGHELQLQKERTENEGQNEYKNVAEVKPVNSQINKHLSNSGTAVEVPVLEGHTSQSEAEETDADLIDAFDRLSKIIRLHVYPSQTPDLSIYKTNSQYTDHYNPLQLKGERDKLMSPVQTQTSKPEKDEMNAAVKFINNMYDFNSEKSITSKIVDGDEYNIKEKKEMKDESMKIVPDQENHSLPWYKNYKDAFVSTSDFESPEGYQTRKGYPNIEFPKMLKDEKPYDNEDEWYQKYVKYYPNDEYHDYSKDSSEGHGYAGDEKESVNSPSIPKRKNHDYSIYRVPEHVAKNWYIKDFSHENR